MTSGHHCLAIQVDHVFITIPDEIHRSVLKNVVPKTRQALNPVLIVNPAKPAEDRRTA